MIPWERWQNDAELRNGVRAVLREWGAWSQGGLANLDFPTHEHWTTPSEEERTRGVMRSPVNVDRAESSEFVISVMATTTRKKSATLLRSFYWGRMPINSLTRYFNKCYKTNESREQVAARLNDAEWIFACLSDTDFKRVDMVIHRSVESPVS